MIFHNGLEVKEPLDKEVIHCLILLNSLAGVKTWSSCSGHKTSTGMVTFYCTNYKTLRQIMLAVFWTTYGYKAKGKVRSIIFNYKQPLWYISHICNGYDVIWDIRMNGNSFKQRVNTTRAWNSLERSLRKYCNPKEAQQ